eukprot:TRINITY_DN24831_c0_g1_i1.p1 TRINITY_DN24831_c0_g1~~TRINITY_DN24831_c0_g1_i1.p1  ORF type:complete len:139 (-),score=15.66 TRINITY_DN24831_c0_g1_i1:37-417(-)
METAWAVQNDAASRMALIQESAAAFESDLVAKVRSHLAGMRGKVRTERDLIEQNSSSTPDVLIDSPGLLVGGKYVRWLDAKNMFGLGLGLAHNKSLKKQGHWAPCKSFRPGIRGEHICQRDDLFFH